MIYTVRVKTGGSREMIMAEGNNMTVYVRARPVDGQANEAVIRLLAKHFRIAKSKVTIIRGQTSNFKHVQILQP
ncbi:MAG: DUF167 domain-containing protein [Candidatus Woesebacteria bacterium]|jgi:uncharacterized protein (TIGR00251 family)